MTPVLDPAADRLVRASLHDVAPVAGFDDAARAVLAHLASAFDLTLWMVTRTVGDDWVVLAATDSPYGLRDGDVLRWSDSLCARMVRGQGPRVAPRVVDVPAYRTAPLARTRPIGSYVGIPLTGPDGGLVGTLCGFSPAPAAESLTSAQPMLELQARLLSGLFAAELRLVRRERSARAAHDGLAGPVLDRHRWEAVLQDEQDRCAAHATPASVIALRLDDPATWSSDADARLRRVLLDRRRPGDAVARTGPGAYAMLCPETLEAVTQRLATDLLLRLQDTGVLASCGVAATDPRDHDLVAAWCRAEQHRRADAS